jgi:hypothetical protein
MFSTSSVYAYAYELFHLNHVATLNCGFVSLNNLKVSSNLTSVMHMSYLSTAFHRRKLRNVRIVENEHAVKWQITKNSGYCFVIIDTAYLML